MPADRRSHGANKRVKKYAVTSFASLGETTKKCAEKISHGVEKEKPCGQRGRQQNAVSLITEKHDAGGVKVDS